MIHISGHMAQNILQPSCPESRSHSPLRVLFQRVHLLRLPTEKYLLHTLAPCSCNLVPFLEHLGLNRKTVQPFMPSTPGRWWSRHFTVTAQSKSGTWHLHVPSLGCLTQHSGALNLSWAEAAGTRGTESHSRKALAQLTTIYQHYPIALQASSCSWSHASVPTGNIQVASCRCGREDPSVREWFLWQPPVKTRIYTLTTEPLIPCTLPPLTSTPGQV